MAGGGGGVDEDLGDVYELLGVSEEAGDKEINAAYRKGSLKCHPDRNPDDEEAAAKFERLTRAKDLLLNPVKRAELDKHRKAKRDLQERYAQEDSKRRKLREDLESRESAHARAESGISAAAAKAEARKRFLQGDFAAKLKAHEAKRAERQAEVVAEAAEARSSVAEARLRVVWRDGAGAVSAQAIRSALEPIEARSIDFLGEGEASVLVDSREEALRAVLQCRERRHQLPFRVTLAAAKGGSEAAPGAPEGAGVGGPGPARRAPGLPPGPGPPAGGFDEWEAKMLEGLRGLAQVQRKAKAQAA